MTTNKNIIGILLLGILSGALGIFFKESSLILISFLIPVFCFSTIYLVTRTLKLITIPYLYLLFFLIFIYIGSVRFSLTNGNYTLLWGVNIGILAFCFGTFFATITSNFNPKREYNDFLNKPISDSMKGLPFDIAFFTLCSISLLVTTYYLYSGIQRTGIIPFFAMITGTGSTRDMILARYEFTHISGAGYFYQFYGNILPFLFLISFAKYLHYKNTKWKYTSILLFLGTSFSLIAAGSRAPILIFVFMIFILLNLYYGKISISQFLKFIIMSFIILFILTFFKFGIGTDKGILIGMLNGLEYTLRRIFIIQSIPIDFVFKHFPYSYDFRFGTTWISDLKGLLPGQQLGFATELARIRSEILGTRATNTPIGFFGELYVNFGLVGVFIGMFILGNILQKLHIYIMRSEKTLVNLAFFAALTQAIAYLSLVALVGVIFQFGVIAFLLSVLFLRIMFSFANISKKRELEVYKNLRSTRD